LGSYVVLLEGILGCDRLVGLTGGFGEAPAGVGAVQCTAHVIVAPDGGVICCIRNTYVWHMYGRCMYISIRGLADVYEGVGLGGLATLAVGINPSIFSVIFLAILAVGFNQKSVFRILFFMAILAVQYHHTERTNILMNGNGMWTHT
jgi:hypothetical protein